MSEYLTECVNKSMMAQQIVSIASSLKVDEDPFVQAEAEMIVTAASRLRQSLLIRIGEHGEQAVVERFRSEQAAAVAGLEKLGQNQDDAIVGDEAVA